jgi:DNA-binding GntR family transcriptional regulator
MKDGLIPAPIARRPLHEELAEHLRQLIIECALEPGSKISEKDLCTQFAVSRTPLREALKLLATEGLVQLTPHRGASVTELTTEELEHIFPVMGALEALAGELACLHVTEAEIERAKKLQAELEAQHKSGDLRGYFRTNEEIHQLIFAAAQNPTLTQMSRSISGRVRRARYMANLSPTRWAAAVKEHRAILMALSKRDGERLGVLLKEHLANKFDVLREALFADLKAASSR